MKSVVCACARGLAIICLFALSSCQTNPLYYSYPDPRPIIRQAPLTLPMERSKFAIVSKMEGFSPLVQWQTAPVCESRGDVYRYNDEIAFLAKFGNQFYCSIECPDRRDIDWIALYFGEDEAMNSFFVCDLTQAFVDQGTEIVFPLRDFRVGAGSPEWGMVRYFQFAFQSRASAAVRLKPYLIASFSGAEK
jgi:hypothetical protein